MDGDKASAAVPSTVSFPSARGLTRSFESPAIRVMAFVEATTVSGTAKAVLEFAREASRPHDHLPPIEFSILTFARTQAESPFIRCVRQEGYSIDIVPEAGRFDFAVLPRIRRAVECR